GSTRLGTLVEHWDGSAWSVVDSPNGPDNNGLGSVVALSPSDVWAVGVTGNDLEQPLAEHYDGTSWSLTTLPHPGIADQLESVTGPKNGRVFAVGTLVRGQPPYLRHGLTITH